MQFFYKISLSLFLSIISLLAFGQADINNENFTSTFVKIKDGGQVIFNGKSHSFSVDINGKNVIEEKKVENPAGNQNFIQCDGTVIQTSWIPLPQPIPENMKLSNLNVEEQKETLDGYVNYELDYFANDLKTKPLNPTKEWVTIGSRLFLVWTFNLKLKKADPNIAKQVIKQIYFSTVCFNQVLDLNIPAFNKNEFEKSKALLNEIALTLKTYNKRLPVKGK